MGLFLDELEDQRLEDEVFKFWLGDMLNMKSLCVILLEMFSWLLGI